MNSQIEIVLIAVACTSAVGLAGMGVIRLLRRASLRMSVQASGIVPVLAIVAGTLGTAEAMFLSQHDLGVVVMVCVVAGIAASALSWLLGRQIASGSSALRHAARSFGDLSTITVYVRRLRDKVEQEPASPAQLQTVWGVGYRWDANPS